MIIAAHAVKRAGHEITLSPKEFELLRLLMANPGNVLSTDYLLDAVWGGAHAGYAHTVNSHINRLRNKIEVDPANPDFIQTVWGVGYVFVPDGTA